MLLTSPIASSTPCWNGASRHTSQSTTAATQATTAATVQARAARGGSAPSFGQQEGIAEEAHDVAARALVAQRDGPLVREHAASERRVALAAPDRAEVLG